MEKTIEQQRFNLSEYKRNLSANIQKVIGEKQARLAELQAEKNKEERRLRLELEGYSELSDIE
jgi:hypothetical protein